MKTKLIVWGASGHAKVIMSYIASSKHEVIAFVDRNEKIIPFNGIPIYRTLEDLLEHESTRGLYFIIAIGGDRGFERMQIHNSLVDNALMPFTFIHQHAWVDKSAIIMEGAQILAMAAVSAGAIVGAQTIINTNATIDHETVIGKGCHVMPAATITGCCHIHDFCTIGSNATILPRLEVYKGAIIGAGAVVTKSILKKGTFIGAPAREIG